MEGRVVLKGSEYLKHAGEFEESFNKVSDASSMMMDIVNEMSSSWEGEAKEIWENRFFNLMDEVNENVNSVCEIEKKISEKVMEIYGIYKECRSLLSLF